jgi:DNA-binding winged helix-turn-helix (wHTH) protein
VTLLVASKPNRRVRRAENKAGLPRILSYHVGARRIGAAGRTAPCYVPWNVTGADAGHMAARESFVFGDFEVDEATCELRLHGAPVKIQPKPYTLLVHLLRNRHRVVDRNELLRTVWPDVNVSEQAFSSAVRDLRRALGDSDAAHRMIVTVRGRGFRFAADVVAEPSGDRPVAEPGMATPVAQGSCPAADLDLVERDDAMQKLRESLGVALQGETRVSFLRGPAGIGKTRLASEFMRIAKTLGVDAHIGRCSDGDGVMPFWPWLQIVRGSIGGRPANELARHVRATLPQLAWIAPELASSSEVAARADLERAEARFRLFDATCVLLLRLSEAKPLLLVLDDLQWADEASLLLLEFLIQTLTRARVHLVAAFRDTPRPNRTLSRVLECGARHASADFVDLEGLHRESVSNLLERAAGAHPAAVFVDSVLAATQGNPLFVEELAKLVARGELDPNDTSGTIPVPKRVRDAIRWQLERLLPDCRRLLELASVVGREFELAALSLASGEHPSTTLEWLGEAEAADLIVPARDQQASFAFTHDLVRESIYQDIRTSDRAHLHRKIAEALEVLSQTDPGARVRVIAYHYSAAVADGIAPKALQFGRLAAEQANSQMAFEDAVAHYDRALSALSAIANHDPQTRCELLLGQAEAAWGTVEDAVSVQSRFVKAADAARIAGSAEFLARAALGRTGHGAGPGDFRDIALVDDTDISLLSEAAAKLGDAPSELRALALARLALAVRYARGASESEDLSREAVQIAERLGALQTLGMVLRFRHEVLSGPKFVRERMALANRILEVARHVRSRPLELDALFFLARAHFELADVEPAAAAGKQADALAGTMRHPGALFRSGIRKVLVLSMFGAFEKAERYARRFHERDAQRNMSAIGTLGAQLATIRTLQGDHTAAVAELERLHAHYPTVPWCAHALALERARVGDSAAAKRELKTQAANGFASVRDDHSSLGCYLNLADLCWELEDRRSAAGLFELLLPYEDQVAAPFLATICQGSVARGLGTLATLLGHADEAERQFVRALKIEERLASPPLQALTLERYGSFLRIRGRSADAGRARMLFERAFGLAEALGMKSVLHRCQQALGARSADEGNGSVGLN